MMLENSSLIDQGTRQIAPGLCSKEESAGANVIDIAIADNRIVAGLGDGRLVSMDANGLETLAQHKGAVTSVSALKGGAVLSAGQDGHLLLINNEGTTKLLTADNAWIDSVAVSANGELVAAAVGKAVSVFSNGELIASFSDHPSTVSGLAFFADGNRLAVSHYNGVSVWSLTEFAKPQRLYWAGSVVSVSVSPNQRYVASATQDRELHIWDLDSGRDFRLGGYQRKVGSMGWATDSSVCFTSGADVIVAWKMEGDPGSQPPAQIGYTYAHTVSAVPELSDPQRIAAGFTDGSIQIGKVVDGTARIARAEGQSEITVLGMSNEGTAIVYGTQCGMLGSIDLAAIDLA